MLLAWLQYLQRWDCSQRPHSFCLSLSLFFFFGGCVGLYWWYSRECLSLLSALNMLNKKRAPRLSMYSRTVNIRLRRGQVFLNWVTFTKTSRRVWRLRRVLWWPLQPSTWWVSIHSTQPTSSVCRDYADALSTWVLVLHSLFAITPLERVRSLCA